MMKSAGGETVVGVAVAAGEAQTAAGEAAHKRSAAALMLSCSWCQSHRFECQSVAGLLLSQLVR